MLTPLSSILVKVFAKGFYKVHSGFLIFLFVTIAIYFFFINILNETHITPDERVLFHLIFVLTFISNPIMVLFIFIIWLLYTIKSWRYIATQIRKPENEFLFYSSTSFNKFIQFRSWLVMQTIIALPILAYALFSVVIGIIFKYFVLPLIIIIYAILLIVVSAIVYVHIVNRLSSERSNPLRLSLLKKLKKPFYSLFIFHIIDACKLQYVITKIASCAFLLGSFYLFQNDNKDVRIEAIMMLLIAVAHAILIYEYHAFDNSYLKFSRNFPYTRSKRLFNHTIIYGMLILPEALWLFITLGSLQAIVLIIFTLAFMLLLHSVLYLFKPGMQDYIKILFALFFIMFILILFKLFWLLIPIIAITAATIFLKYYYCPRESH